MIPAKASATKRPVPPPGRKLSFREAQELLKKKYGKTLAALAKK